MVPKPSSAKQFIVKSIFLPSIKSIINTYTWTSLPLYTFIQRPWRQLKQSRITGVKSYIDSSPLSPLSLPPSLSSPSSSTSTSTEPLPQNERIIYYRPSSSCSPLSIKDINNHTKNSQISYHTQFLKHFVYTECWPYLDRKQKMFGVRQVLSEELQYEKGDNGDRRVKLIDGKELKHVRLANAYHWYSVGDILDRVDSLAKALQNSDTMGNGNQIKPGDKVILYAENSLEWFITSLALQRLNAITVTLLSILSKHVYLILSFYEL